MNDNQVFGAMAEGLERVSKLVTEYAIVEALYLSERYLAMDHLTEAIVRLYSAILVYFSKACRFYSKSTLGMYHYKSFCTSCQTKSRIKDVLQAV